MVGQNGNLVSSFGSGGLYQMSEHDGELLDIVVETATDCFYACGYE